MVYGESPRVDDQLIQDFIKLFNAIHHALVDLLRMNEESDFRELLEVARKRHKISPDLVEHLELIRKIRNFIVHESFPSTPPAAVPTPWILTKMEDILHKLASTKRVIDLWKKPVERVGAEESLRSVLEKIMKFNFSQFPVYNKNAFVGLLTVNGIARWLASCVLTGKALDPASATVSEVLQAEENLENVRFINADATADEAWAMFANHPILEALLITKTGRADEELEGIITRVDVFEFVRNRA